MPGIPDRRSPCRIDQAKGKRRHHCSDGHAAFVDGFREAQRLQNERAEEATLGYETELKLYFDPHDGTERRLTLRDWMIQSRNETRER